MSSLSALDKARGLSRRAEASLLLAAVAAAAARLVTAVFVGIAALSLVFLSRIGRGAAAPDDGRESA